MTLDFLKIYSKKKKNIIASIDNDNIATNLVFKKTEENFCLSFIAKRSTGDKVTDNQINKLDLQYFLVMMPNLSFIS